MVIDWREHIAVDPAVLVGKPVVRGTRLALEFILSLVEVQVFPVAGPSVGR